MKQENKFVLPEKWHIIVNEENKIKVNNWYGNGDSFLKPKLHICGMAKQCGIIEKGYNELPNIKNGDGNDASYDFGIEITFRQFQEHVLKEIPKPEYDPKDVAFKPKIVGYKLIKPEYKEAVKSIVSNLGDGERWFNDSFNSNMLKRGYNFSSENVQFGIFDTLKKSGVMHWFEPVYQESKQDKIIDLLACEGIEIDQEMADKIIEIVNEK